MKERLIRHYLFLILITLISGIVFYLNKGQRNTVTFIAWSSGYISIVLLAVSMIIGPYNIMFRRNNPASTYIRRDLSISAGFLAILHSVTGLFVHLRGKTYLYFLNKTDTGFSIRTDNFGIANYTGLIAVIIILVLLVISNDMLLKKLTPGKWKNIQRLSYLMFVLILIHSYCYHGEKENLIRFFYLPMLLIIIIMQGVGILIRSKRHKA